MKPFGSFLVTAVLFAALPSIPLDCLTSFLYFDFGASLRFSFVIGFRIPGKRCASFALCKSPTSIPGGTMKSVRRNILLVVCAALLTLWPAASQVLQSPEQFLGFRVGADYKLADYETIQKYFKHLAANSGRLLYEPAGKTVQGREMFSAVISSEENIRNLEKIRETVRKLSDPRTLTDEDARRLTKEGKIIVLVTCNIHSTEIASSQMSMELAYDLVTRQGRAETLDALRDVVFLLMPSINPDGTTMVVNWYNKYLNTEYDGSSMPYLYHVYAGHDDNRDWFMFNLPETRGVVDVAYHKWFPQIWLDEHQMGSNGARLFVVPYQDPINPNVNTMIWRWQKAIGALTSLSLEKQGLTGVIDQAMFDGWWEGSASDCGMWHNQISLLSEMASCNVASPVYIDPSEVKATSGITTYDKRSNYPSPWRGGWWRLRDIVDYELALTNTLLETAGRYREELLYNYYLMGKAAVEKGKTEKPFAYVIPRDQNDPGTTAKMIEILQMGGVEVQFSDKPVTVGAMTYPAGSYLIYLAQPNGRYAKDLFDEQHYPDLRQTRKDSPIRPYDVAGWTLPYLMGVQFFTVDDQFTAETRLLTDANRPAGSVATGPGKYFAIKAGPNANSTLINRLQREHVRVFWNTKPLTQDAKTYPPGSVFVPVEDAAQKILSMAANDLGLTIDPLSDVDVSSLRELKKVRVGLYKSYSATADEGWTRLLLENYGFDVISMVNKDFKNKKLKDAVDVIIFPEQSADVIKTGKGTGEYARFSRPKPPEFEGGIEKEGVENLKKFVEQDGGCVIALGEACNFAIEDLGLRVTNTLKSVKSDDFFCPGSILRISVDNTNPIGYGMEAEASGYLSSNIAFSTSVPFGEFDRSVVVRYPASDLLKSGFLIGEDYLFQRPAIVDVKQKKGHVVLMGINVQDRHWTFGTFKLLFNAIQAAGMLPLEQVRNIRQQILN